MYVGDSPSPTIAHQVNKHGVCMFVYDPSMTKNHKLPRNKPEMSIHKEQILIPLPDMGIASLRSVYFAIRELAEVAAVAEPMLAKQWPMDLTGFRRPPPEFPLFPRINKNVKFSYPPGESVPRRTAPGLQTKWTKELFGDEHSLNSFRKTKAAVADELDMEEGGAPLVTKETVGVVAGHKSMDAFRNVSPPPPHPPGTHEPRLYPACLGL